MTTIPIQPAPASNWQMVRALGGVGVLCALLIVLTYQWTLPVIQKNQAEALQRAIYNVLPGAVSSVAFEITDDDALRVAAPQSTGERVYAGYDADGALVGVAVAAAGQGFQDVIRLIYGYSPARQHVIGMEVLESKETPGLGDKIIKDAAFVANFEALDVTLDAAGAALAHAVVAVKSGQKQSAWEIDGITGATISSVAVAKIIDASARVQLPRIRRNLAALRAGAPQQETAR